MNKSLYVFCAQNTEVDILMQPNSTAWPSRRLSCVILTWGELVQLPCGKGRLPKS